MIISKEPVITSLKKDKDLLQNPDTLLSIKNVEDFLIDDAAILLIDHVTITK